MPWKETSPVKERMRFILDFESGLFEMKELAEHFGVSRKTAYKWLGRWREEGAGGLEGRAPVAETVANRTAEELEKWFVEQRKRHWTWGPKKLLKVLSEERPDGPYPCRSTVCAILKRHGLVRGPRRRRREGHPGRPTGDVSEPNAVWGADFKGQFRTRDGRYCYPFTVTDLHSRYLLACDGGLSPTTALVRTSLERLFRENGLPEAIRTDNGAPFASTGIGRLTQLGAWLIRYGIQRQLIQPGKPSQNGRHERMHKTLKEEATLPPSANLRKQQERFDSFRREFNEIRPHEALGQSRPAELYRPSPRPFPETEPKPEYPAHYEVRRVSRNGGIRWKGEWLNVGHSLIEENVGMEEVDTGVWSVFYYRQLIGRFDERNLELFGTMGTHGRCGKRGNRT
jgi:transposase InsO family protein